MLNIGGGELLVIMLVALIVLGPTKLPEVARQVGGVVRELKRMSAGFQAELKSALDDTTEDEARERGRKVVSSEQPPAPSPPAGPTTTTETSRLDDERGELSADEPGPQDPPISTAEAAGMYDISADDTTSSKPDRAAAGDRDETDT